MPRAVAVTEQSRSDPDAAGIALSFRNISKSFGATPAVDDVSFDVREGEIHALVGENGAGKSTLIRILDADQPFRRKTANHITAGSAPRLRSGT